MTFEIWLAFVAASTALVLIPGPTVLLVVSYALGQGWRAALPMAVGVALGDFTAMSLSVLGIGALLMASATLFTIVKWVGAAYLVYLGIKLFQAGGTLNAEPKTDGSSALRMCAHAWLVTSLNPKGILFFVAFFPQFIEQQTAFWPQVFILQGTFLVIAFANALTYAFFASRARGLVRSERVISAVNKTGGAMLIGAGVASVAIRTGN
jgi:threonine/homoserine/homoserine lactone efflux protein